jgi:hypothetical protein
MIPRRDELAATELGVLIASATTRAAGQTSGSPLPFQPAPSFLVEKSPRRPARKKIKKYFKKHLTRNRRVIYSLRTVVQSGEKW